MSAAARNRRLTTLAIIAMAPILIGASLEKQPLWQVIGKRSLQIWVQQTPHRDAVKRAVGEWNAQALPLRFRFAPDSIEADVRVYWIDKFDEPISGRTTCIDEGGRHIVRADVVLANRHSDGRALNAEEMRVLALHELGHAIGLSHLADSNSVMAARVRVRSISREDRKLALQLYTANNGKR